MKKIYAIGAGALVVCGSLAAYAGGSLTLVPRSGNAVEVTSAPTGTEGEVSTPGEKLRMKGYTAELLASGEAAFISEQGDTLLAGSPTAMRTATSRWYGAGERGLTMDLNGDTLVMWNRPNYGYSEGDSRLSQMGITMPYVLSDRGFGVLFNDHSRATLKVGDNSLAYNSENKRPWSYTFIGGGTMPEATANFHTLTGHQDLPPFWALGYITSKYGYHTDSEALGAVDSLKRAGYPVDGLVFDLYWYGKETDMGRLEWAAKQFPDHKAMLDSLNAMHVNTVLIHQPYINKIGALDNYKMLGSAGLLVPDSAGNVKDVHTWVGDAGMFDVSNPATREWMWQRLRPLTAEGLAGWWGDLGEPEQHEPAMRHANGLGIADYHNVYGNDWSQLVYEGMRKDFPDKRPFLLMRGGTTGLQRWSVFPWTGDVARSWGGLQPQIRLMLNSGLSGLGYMSSDIGGFAVDANRPTDPELYLRWLQYGVFSPILRTHAQMAPEPYHYPEYAAQLLDLVKMRYRWLPYNYTLAYENSALGQPLARPVTYYDKKAGATMPDDEYLWGSEVLVAPVMTAGAKTRKVWFPASERSLYPDTWYYWFDVTKTYKGGTWAEVATPLDEFPLFVKSGNFIPQYEKKIDNVSEYDQSVLTVKYFRSRTESEYTLFDDDRRNPESLSSGEYQLTRFKAVPFSGRKLMKTPGEAAATLSPEEAEEARLMERPGVTIEISSEGKYADMPKQRMIRLQLVGIPKPVQVTVDGEPIDSSYNPNTATLSLLVRYNQSHATVMVR